MTPATSSSDSEIAVRIRGLEKGFGKFQIHKGLDLDIPKGKITYIMGGSGTGKSLLLKQIMGFLTPDKGSIEIHGEKLDWRDPEDVRRIRRHMGILFQNGALFDSMSAYDNVAFSLTENLRLAKREIDERVEALLKSVGLGMEHSEKMPSGLSGGQRKRVALARAIAMKPSIMMYDEPTTGLDPITTMMVTNLIRNTNEENGLTSIVISHDTHVVFTVAEHIAFLKDGRIQYQGHPQGVFDDPDPGVQEFFSLEAKYRKNGGKQ
ncbi:MAG: ATP-binding cassette domain-containing protein [Bdellovibrionales bacterium]|nr:ATP-binding cassette domain-containing protein [Bdellovibrionales bacterium]